MRTRWLAVAVAVAVGGAAGFALAGSASSIGISVSIVGPRAAEMSAWVDVRVKLVNSGADPARVHVMLTLPLGSARPSAGCSGSPNVECQELITGGGTTVLTVPARWDKPGRGTIDVRATAAESSAETSASSFVSVYTLALVGLRTSPVPARAGKAFVVAATLARSDTHEALRARSLRCAAVTAAAPAAAPISTLRGTGTISGARLTCLWRLPVGARGRYVRAYVLADTHRGGMVTKQPFWRRIR